MLPRQNLQIVGQGLARLTSAYITQANCRAWLAAILQPWQDLEDATWSVLTARQLTTATLYNLPQTNVVFDVIGDLVGIQRNGLSDQFFQALILLQIAVNRATGRTLDWSRFAQILGPYTSEGILYLDGTADFEFGLWNLTLPPQAVGRALSIAVPNGIGASLAYTTWPDIGTDIEFTSVYDSTAGQSGFSSVYDATAGGVLAAALTLA
jgi:hypothetical protein